MTHTPGPWEWQDQEDGTWWLMHIDADNDGYIILEANGCPDDPDKTAIEALPDLLEACEAFELMTWNEAYKMMPKVIGLINAALKKARG